MKKWLGIITAAVLIPLSLYAGVRAYDSSGALLGGFASIECGDGLTCAQSSGRLNMVSNSVQQVLTLGEADAEDVEINFDGNAQDYNISLDDSADDLVIGLGLVPGTTDAIRIDENQDVTFVQDILPLSTITGDGGAAIVGMLQNQVASSGTTLTIAQCGSTIVGAGVHTLVLPEASTALGCRYTFVGGTADTVTIDPADGTDQIGALNFVAGGTAGAIAPSAGDAISFTDTGASVVLEAVGANLWVSVGVANLTITDAN